MKRLGILIPILFLLIVLTCSAERAIVSKEVYTQLEEKNTTRVFITLKNESMRQKGVFSRQVVNKDITTMVDRRKIKSRFNNSFSAIVNKEELKQLEAEESIDHIEIVGTRKLFLQNTIPIINASLAYTLQVNTLNLTGAGQTICILDTGVNYSHSDLGGCYGNNSITSGCKVIGGWDYCADDTTCTTEDNNPMDVNGHGTHVSGIVAANGTIKGVAKDAKIVMIKIFNTAGEAYDDDIISGINWCVNNASSFNISVISMSFGGGLYTNNCNSDVLTPYIQTAIARNISVVAASGNSGSATRISSPACIENVSAIGATTKSDAIASYSNRNNLVSLVAPGGDSSGNPALEINSTWINGGYRQSSGTSMATPHVAGAIALLNQMLRNTAQTKTPQELKNILNATGKLVYDTSSNLNYSRINIYNALLYLDNSAPVTNLITTNYTNITENTTQFFSANFTDWQLSNVTFYLWNTSNTINQTTISLSGQFNSTNITVSNLRAGNYTWNFLAVDARNNQAFATNNISLEVYPLEVQLISPLNATTTNLNQTFLCNLSSISNLTNVTFYLWNTTGLEITLVSNISGFTNQTTQIYNFTHEGTYLWNCLGRDNNSSNFASNNFSVTYDTTSPIIQINSPLNTSFINSGRFNLTLNEQGSCNYSLTQGSTNHTMNTTDSLIFSASNTTLQESGYNITYFCADFAGNKNSSSVSFTVDTTLPVINVFDPSEGYSFEGTRSVTFTYNVSDASNVSNCSLILNNVIVSTNTSLNTSINQSFLRSISPGTYTWGINCTDLAGNTRNASSRSLVSTAVVSATVSSGGGGGGGGGGGSSPTPEQSKVPLKKENTLQNNPSVPKEINSEDKERIQEIKEKEIFNFLLEGKSHSLKIERIFPNEVEILLQSDPIFLKLKLGEEKKVKLSNGTYYDLLLKLESIKNQTANITLKKIHEEIVFQEQTIKNNLTIPISKETIFKKNSNAVKLLIYYFAILGIGILFFKISIKQKKKE